MRERIEYFSRKFINNGIGCFVLYLMFFSFVGNEHPHPVIVSVIVLGAGALWIALGLRIRKRLKQKQVFPAEDSVCPKTEGKLYKWIPFTGWGFLVLLFIGSLHQEKFFEYVGIAGLLLYSAWLYIEVTMINEYLKS